MNEKDYSTRLADAVREAWKQMLAEGTRYDTAEMQSGEEGPAVLRAKLPAEFRDEPLSIIRKVWLANNRAGRMASGKRVSHTTARDRIVAAARRAKTKGDCSPEYNEWIASLDWRDRASTHKRDCEYRCQLCARVRVGADLEVHHIHYESLKKERIQDLLCLCCDGCHEVADYMRQSGGDIDGLDPDNGENALIFEQAGQSR